jgi:hypothetical protein
MNGFYCLMVGFNARNGLPQTIIEAFQKNAWTLPLADGWAGESQRISGGVLN